MKAIWSGLSVLLIVWLVTACSSTSNETEPGPGDGDIPEDGDSPEEFISAGEGMEGYDGGGTDTADGDTPDNADPSNEGDGRDDLGREIIEADIFSVDGDTMYVLNRYRGLAIIDFADPGEMKIVGRLKMEGVPKEMFVDDGIATILLTELLESGENGYRSMSSIVTIDVSDPANPLLLHAFPAAGRITDSRRVGDVIYVVSGVQPWWDYCVEPDWNAGTVEIYAINVADPSAVFMADTLSFEGSGWNAYVTENAMYISSVGYENFYDGEGESASSITYIDISDPAGRIVRRGEFQASALVTDRFKMYQHGDTFAATSVTDSWNGTTFFETFDVSDPDAIERLAKITIMEDEELHASRYSGTRAYIVTFRNTDPLFVVDFADPANPAVLGDLEIPGWSTHLEIRGTKIYGVGVDDGDGWRTKVALFDVSDPTNPTELDALSLGQAGSYSHSEALTDWKAFKVYDELGLILVPTEGYDEYWNGYVNQLNIIEFDDSSLSLMGSVGNDSTVRRGFVAGKYIASLSDTRVQLIDIDSGEPAFVGGATIATTVERLFDCAGEICDIKEGTNFSNLRLRIFDDATLADQPKWQSRLLRQSNYYGWDANQVLANNDMVYIVSDNNRYGDWGMPDMEGGGNSQPDSGAEIFGFDLGGNIPEYMGTASLENEDVHWYYGSRPAGLLDNGTLFRVIPSENDEDSFTFELRFYDISDFDDIEQTDVYEGIMPVSLRGEARPIQRGNSVWGPSCENFGEDDQGRPQMKCYAINLDASEPDDVRETAKINIPGQLIGMNESGNRMVSIDKRYIDGNEDRYNPCTYSLEFLQVVEGGARRMESIDLFIDDYCYRNEYPDGDTPSTTDPDPGPVPTDGDEVSDGDVYVDGEDNGTMEDSGDEGSDGQAIGKKILKASRPDDEDADFAGVHIAGERAFVFWNLERWYDGNSVVPDGDEYDDMPIGECMQPDSSRRHGKTWVYIYMLEDGSLDQSLEFDDVSSWSVVQGGGMLLSGARDLATGVTLDLIYLSDNGETTVLQSPEHVNLDFRWSYYGQALRLGDELFLPFGWDGIKRFAL